MTSWPKLERDGWSGQSPPSHGFSPALRTRLRHRFALGLEATRTPVRALPSGLDCVSISVQPGSLRSQARRFESFWGHFSCLLPASSSLVAPLVPGLRPSIPELLGRRLPVGLSTIAARHLPTPRSPRSRLRTHAITEERGAGGRRGQVDGGLPRYDRYVLKAFLISRDGVRHVEASLKFLSGSPSIYKRPVSGTTPSSRHTSHGMDGTARSLN